MIRPSAAATIRDYLHKADERVGLEDAEEKDLEKALEHIQKAEKEINKELE